MAFDFETYVRNLTRADTLSVTVINWAVDIGKVLYTCEPATSYDDSISDVDNTLISILASAFITMYLNGTDIPSAFKLDELSIEFNDKVAGAPEKKFFDMFFSWLKRFQMGGCVLQYADSSTLMDITSFTAPSVVASLTLPENFE